MTTAIVPVCRECGDLTPNHFAEAHFRVHPSHPTTEAELMRVASVLGDGWRLAVWELEKREGFSMDRLPYAMPYHVIRRELGLWCADPVLIARVALTYAAAEGVI